MDDDDDDDDNDDDNGNDDDGNWLNWGGKKGNKLSYYESESRALYTP